MTISAWCRSKIIKEKLDEKVEDVVNSVWVDVNTASYTLLQYVAGLSEKLHKILQNIGMKIENLQVKLN